MVGEETARPANTSANPNQFELSRIGNPHTKALARQPRWGWPDRGCDLIQPLRFSHKKNFSQFPVYVCSRVLFLNQSSITGPGMFVLIGEGKQETLRRRKKIRNGSILSVTWELPFAF